MKKYAYILSPPIINIFSIILSNCIFLHISIALHNESTKYKSNSLSNVFVHPNSSTTYSLVSVTSAYGCPILSTNIQGSATISVSSMTQAGSITGGGNNVCTGTNSTTLNLNNAVGTIQWQSSIDSINYTNISGAANTTLQVSNLTSKKYFNC